MKLTIGILALSASILVSSCNNMAGDDDYSNAASDICDCVNKATQNLSPEFKRLMENPTDQEAITKWAEENPTEALESLASVGDMQTSIENCTKKLEAKYKDLYTNDSEMEVLNKLMDKLKENSGCRFTYKVMLNGLQGKYE
ncbi:MAG: hypothetical protein FJ340_06480 [Sphingomonadales bacterium]|nr:hypothetical protein [Sphingomonadales bacterium]